MGEELAIDRYGVAKDDSESLFASPEVEIQTNGINASYDGGYSAMISFSGYSSTGLCAKYKRSAEIDGHECPLERDW